MQKPKFEGSGRASFATITLTSAVWPRARQLLQVALLAQVVSMGQAATISAISPSRTDVAAAIALASDGDTVTIPAGAAGWTSTLIITKAITLLGAGINQTIIYDDVTNSSSQPIIAWSTTAGKRYRMSGIDFQRALRGTLGDATTNVITSTGHNLSVNDTISFVTPTSRDPNDIPLVGGAGITAGTTYFVKSVPSPHTFTISATQGGAELDFTTDIAAGQWIRSRSGFDKGAIRVTGFSSEMRIDHCRFMNLQNEFIHWTNAYGVIDNCVSQHDGGSGRLLMFNHRAVGTGGVEESAGDSSWSSPIDWLGDRNAVVVEDCTMSRTTPSNADDVFGATDCIEGGGRLIFRHNTLTRMTIANHGTESSQRFRGGRMIEAHENVFDLFFATSPMTVDTTITARSGTVIAWGNRFTGLFNSNVKLLSYRVTGSFPPWGIADGTKAWDTPDLTDGVGTPGGAGDGVFEAGTSTAGASNSLTDSSKAWTPNQWAQYSLRTLFPFTATSGTTTTVTVNGAGWTTNQWQGYEFTRDSDNSKGEVASNTADTLTLSASYFRPNMSSGGAFTLSRSGFISSNTATTLTMSGSIEGQPRTYRAGAYEIRKVSKVLDDAGLGPTTTPVGTNPINHQNLNQGMDPCYIWDNLKRTSLVGAYSNIVVSTSGYPSLKANRNYYVETAGFDGTVGVGVGLLANRPVTCTTGVGYWATDTSRLYVATATNTWTMYYKPYDYPHPLRRPAPPTNLRISNP